MRGVLNTGAWFRTAAVAAMAIAGSLAMSAAAPAAALKPGAAFVWAGYVPGAPVGDHTTYSFADYGPTHITTNDVENLLPRNGHTVTAHLGATKKSVVFDAPGTLVLKDFSAFDPQRPNPCSGGLGIGQCPLDPRGAGLALCSIGVWGGLGADVVSVRDMSGSPYCLRVEVDVFASRGNDLINTRNGTYDVVFCGPGYDRVYADAGDAEQADCEAVYLP
jgi:hypothetical protein